MILTIRTDNPVAELGLYDVQKQLAYVTWEAHRQLAETIHKQIDKILSDNDKNLKDLSGIVCFQGPGSFTGLRIGLSVANALAVGLGVPIVSGQGTDWLQSGMKRLVSGQNDVQVVPFYGAEAHITPQKK